jgi:SpoVK/Ycf46/Vps4 family AAA+-type ATPase
MANALHPTNGQADAVADALGGLSLDAAEQASAECLAAHRGWNPDHLRAARKQILREAGLELWPTNADLGGLGGLREYVESEVLPWVRHPKLAVRRLLCAGVPGVGKSYCATWIAHRIGCECAHLSVERLKAGIVGASGANLRRCLATIDALTAESTLVVVLDEIDKLATEGLDGGTSSGMFAELLDWLPKSKAVVIATLNHLDKLNAALESRFQARFFFDLPTQAERRAVARIHYADLGCTPESLDAAATATAQQTDGFSSREIARNVCESALRRGNLAPTANHVIGVVSTMTPSSITQAEQLAAMRKAASSLRRANDPQDDADPHASRRIIGGAN